MTIDDLVDLLKRRECDSVCYFHTDHFEPWSSSISESAARAVDRMAAMARSSPYARRLSLFYSVFVPYRLATDGPVEGGDRRVGEDGVVFGARSSRQETLAREAVRPLVVDDGHEMHLHVHHEFWTHNTSHFDHPVSRWVNSCSTPDADRARLDLHFELAKQAISREIGRPFDRWAFIHGNWALNASDPLICHVSDEMAIIMRHGGFGDFSFPAGRSYCDPKLESPFTCLPLDLVRAYDDPRADARAIGPDSGVMTAERFLIWNSPIKSIHSSLDYYSAANRTLFKSPERVVANWLTKSVSLGRRLFIKTHAHTMRADYGLAEEGSFIPHCYPDVVSVFDCLARTCERAGIELQLKTVNEVVGHLQELDGAKAPASLAEKAPTKTVDEAEPRALDAKPDDSPSLPPLTPAAMAVELGAMHEQWLASDGASAPADDLYRTKINNRTPLEAYEVAIASAIADRYPADLTKVVEIGCGWGGLAILLARLGFEVHGFEGNVRRHTACRWHFEEQIRRFPALRGRLVLAPVGLFPEAMSSDTLARDKINLCIATNITSSYSAEHQREIARAAAGCDDLILDLARFGQPRDGQSARDDLLRDLTAADFKPVERLYFKEPYEYWRLRSRLAASRRPPSSAATTSQAPSSVRPAASGRQKSLFPVFGDQQLGACPVCHSDDIAPLWRMPATTLSEPIQLFGGYFNQVPTLQTPGTLYCFDFCHACESIFLNPVPSQQKQGYRQSDHYVRKMRTAAEWREYESVYDSFAPWIPANARVMVDAACGIGQYLHVARRRNTHPWEKLIGLELAEKYVEDMCSEGLEGHVFDIDADDLEPIVPAGTADFICFSEAFEHVDRPLDALRKLVTALRSGGRLYFTAQRYGDDVQAAVRPGEPIYIGSKLVNELPERLGCRIVNMTTSSMRYYVVLEK